MPKWPLLVLLMMARAPLAAADGLDDFEREAPEIPSSPAAKLSLVEAPAGSAAARGKALAVDWSFPHAPWIEFAYAKPLLAIEKEPEGSVGLTLETWQPAAPGMIQFGFRMLDARGEVFQWGASLPRSAEAGWRSVTVPISGETANAHWAGNNNGIIEYPLRLFGYSMVFANAQVPAGRALIDAVRLVPLPKVMLETDRYPWLVNATGASKCDLVIANPGDKPLTVAVNGTLVAYSGPPATVAGTVEVPPNGAGRLAVPLGERQTGYRRLECVLKYDGAEIPFKAPFVVADPLVRVNGKQDFLFSICSHTETMPADQWEAEFQAVAAAGAGVMRVGPPWANVEPKPGEFKWDALDRLVQLGAQYGIEIQFILGMGPSHALPSDKRAEQTEAYMKGQKDAWAISLFGAPEEASWRRYVSAVVTRYKGKIRLYEIWNEPDLGFWRGTTDEYIGILKAAYEEIHKADPAAQVMTGGFATVLEHAGRAKNPNLQERVLKEASDSFDIHAIHQHGPFQEFRGAVDGELARLRAQMPHKKPLYFNETSLAAFGDEKGQALAVVKKMSYVMSLGAIGYTWYDLRNDGIDPANAEHNYGLLTNSMRPKPAYGAYMEAVRRLQGRKAAGTLDFGSWRPALAFGGPKGRTLVWWNEGNIVGPVAALFKVPAGEVRSIDVMGNAAPLPVVDGFVLAQSAREPKYLEFPAGPGKPELAGELVRVEGPAEAMAAQPLNLKTVVTNPLNREITVDLSWNPPGGKKTARLVVPPKSQGSLDMPALTVGARVLAASLDVDFAVQGTPWTGSVRYAAPASRLISAAVPDGRAADWTLSNRWEMVSLTGADPALSALVWKNADDLSAAIWLWQQDGAVRVRVDVKDDAHVQNEKAGDIWKGDSVQMAFQGIGAKGGWEIGAGQAADGTVLKSAWEAPPGVTNGADLFSAKCEPLPGGLRYEFELPMEKMGVDAMQLKKGLRFNLLVNDNDGTLRETFTRVADGLGIRKDVNLFPVVKSGE